MKRLLILYLFMLLGCTYSQGQSKLGNEWITGLGGQHIKFNSNNSIITDNPSYLPSYFTQGNSNICDTNGNLILSSDGYNIFDSMGNYIDEGDTIVYLSLYNKYVFSPYSQSSIFLPMDSNKYYFITPTYHDGNACFSCHFDEILYSIIDMDANAGAGKVTKRMIPFAKNGNFSRTQMMACKHSNGRDWWLLKQGGDSNIVYKYLFTQDSVYDKGQQVFNAPFWGGKDFDGQTTISKDGSRYASACESDGLLGEIFLADFDRCYGILSNTKVIQMPVWTQNDPNFPSNTERSPVGLTFSPNGLFLYVMGYSNIFQYDLSANSWIHVAGLDTTYAKFQYYSNSYLGPDSKVYIGNFGGLSKQMSVINKPDLKGAACEFCSRCLRLDSLGGPNNYSVGTPPCMPNYSLGAQVCWPLNTNETEKEKDLLILYPNPVRGTIFITTKSKAVKEFYNSVGQLLKITSENFIDLSGLASGIYYLKCGAQVQKVLVE